LRRSCKRGLRRVAVGFAAGGGRVGRFAQRDLLRALRDRIRGGRASDRAGGVCGGWLATGGGRGIRVAAGVRGGGGVRVS
jgi:hypothetical protein